MRAARVSALVVCRKYALGERNPHALKVRVLLPGFMCVEGSCRVMKRDRCIPVVEILVEVSRLLAQYDEGDPFGGPVAMRLGVGGLWSTVERTRLV